MFNLTQEDADFLERAALQLGFTSRGNMLTAIMERLCIARLAPTAFLKVGWQLATRASETGASKGAGFWNPFRDPIPPFDPAELPRPPLPMPEEELAPQKQKILQQVEKQTP